MLVVKDTKLKSHLVKPQVPPRQLMHVTRWTLLQRDHFSNRLQPKLAWLHIFEVRAALIRCQSSVPSAGEIQHQVSLVSANQETSWSGMWTIDDLEATDTTDKLLCVSSDKQRAECATLERYRGTGQGMIRVQPRYHLSLFMDTTEEWSPVSAGLQPLMLDKQLPVDNSSLVSPCQHQSKLFNILWSRAMLEGPVGNV